MRRLESADRGRIERVIASHLHELTPVRGFLAARPGFPISGGRLVREPAIVVFVRQKRSPYELAKVAANMVDAVLNDKKPEVNDTKSYDNGAKVVPAYLLQPVSVDKSNYKQVLVDGGYYTEDQLK